MIREISQRAQATLGHGRAWVVPHIVQTRHWLSAPRPPLTWAALGTKLTTPKLLNTYFGRLAALGIIVLLLVPLWHWYAQPHHGEKGEITYPHASLVNPILGGLGALFLIYAAIRQARTGTEVARTGNRQAEIASRRHVTETFGKAVEQLGNEKMEVRIGGIYTLERLAREALTSPPTADRMTEEGGEPDLYWAVMETLTAFVREQTRPETERLVKPREQRLKEGAYLLWKSAGSPEGSGDEFWSKAVEQEAQKERPATDIAAVLEVIRRRPEAGVAREKDAREKQRQWYFDLRGTDLRGADLGGAHLEGAHLFQAHLEGANLNWAHLEGARLDRAHLEGTALDWAHLESATLVGAHLEGAHLFQAHLEGANLNWAHLEGARLDRAHLERAVLDWAHLESAALVGAHLEGARLDWAYLEGARLDWAHLEGAHLHGAHLEGAVLTRAKLHGALSLVQQQLDQACGEDVILDPPLTIKPCPPAALGAEAGEVSTDADQ